MNNNNKLSETFPKLLNNAPCEEDLFEGKSHQNIANAICHTILNNKKANIIGIDGDWGSGKSNLVGLIKKNLDEKNYNFFIYDAWGHQDDLQRRSILEELTYFLTTKTKKNKAILDSNKWNDKLKNLLARKRELQTKIVPKLGIGIIISFFIIILTPISSIISKSVDSSWDSILIASIPFLGGLVIVLGWILCSLICPKRKKKLVTIFKELFYVYQDKVKENTTYESISEKEPSSREFKEWIHEIDKDLKSYNLILVFDNMDRLPAEKVQKLWAVIHSFFADEQYEKIRVIIPFDRAHIISAFKNEDIIQYSNKSSDSNQSNQSNDDNKQCYGNDFINKTFNVIYRVSPPTMSNWKTFFNKKWEEAFGISLSNESRVTQIYDVLTDKQTPRKIIAFINEFVSIKQICSEYNIPDQYIALFIFGKSKIAIDPEQEIISPSYLKAMDFLYLDDDEMPKYICALYYQLHPENAIDIIYTDQIKRYLDNNDSKLPSEKEKIPHFNEILENAITKVSNIPNATLALNSCFKDMMNKEIITFWDTLYNHIKNDIPRNLEEYQKILLTKITDKDNYLKSIINQIYNDENFSINDFYRNITKLIDIKGIDAINKLKSKKVKPVEFIDFIKLAKIDYKQYKIECNEIDLDQYLSTLQIDQIQKLDIIPFIINDLNNKLVHYSDHLYESINLYVNNRVVLNNLFVRLKEVNKTINTPFSDVNLYNLLNEIDEEIPFYIDVICMRISRLNNYDSNYAPSFNLILQDEDEALIENIARMIEYYISYGELLENLPHMNYPLYKGVVKKLTENIYRKSQLNLISVLAKYESIIDKLDVEPLILFNRLDSFSNSLKKEESINMKSIPIKFYSDATNINNTLSKKFIDMANDYLEGLSVDEWEKSIKDSSYDYQLFLILQPNKQNYFDAIKNLLKKYANGEIEALDKAKIEVAIKWTNKYNRNLLAVFNTVRDRFCENDKMNLAFFDFYGEWLFKYSELDKKQEVLRMIFKTEILDQDKNISLILKNVEIMQRIIAKAGAEADDFKDKISSLLSNQYYDNVEFIKFAKSIGINQEFNNAEE